MLIPTSLVHDFGRRSNLAQTAVQTLAHQLANSHDECARLAFSRWQSEWAGSGERGAESRALVSADLGAAYNLPRNSMEERLPLFAVQTYFAIVAKLWGAAHLVAAETAARNPRLNASELPWITLQETWRSVEQSAAFGGDGTGPLATYGWYLSQSARSMAALIPYLIQRMAQMGATPRTASVTIDPLRDLYLNLLPRESRRALGEFYTPDWLVRHVLDQLGCEGQAGIRFLDPTCGSGVFLLEVLRRRIASFGSRFRAFEHPEHLDELLTSAAGCDRNPLAVLAARANYLTAISAWQPDLERLTLPVYLGDALLNPLPLEPCDMVGGNPPWIVWDHLPPEYREATKPLWQKYGLFNLSAKDARHGGGKKDLSTLLVATCADRYLKPGGRLGFVITQTIFQSKRAGDGFRRFRLGADGSELKVLRVDDLTAVKPFPDVANWSSVIFLEKGAPTEYPVSYYVWSRENGPDGTIRYHQTRCLASPIDAQRRESPWAIRRDGDRAISSQLTCPADYHGHLGANTGGVNGVLWLDILDRNDALVLVRNRAVGKRQVAAVEHWIEADLVYPLVRWGDIRRFHAAPSAYLLMPQDVSSRRGIAEDEMRKCFPKSLEFLQRFETEFRQRAAYRRYQARGTFYSLYDVGRYTVADFKVVWRRMDRQINAAVAEAVEDDWLGSKPVVPQESCALIDVGSRAEADYLCSVLNSTPVNQLVISHSVLGGKGFGTPSMLEYLPIRRYSPEDERHRRLSELSREAHSNPDSYEAVLREIDRLVNEQWDG